MVGRNCSEMKNRTNQHAYPEGRAHEKSLLFSMDNDGEYFAMLNRNEVHNSEFDFLLKEISTASTQFDVLRMLKKTTERYRAKAFMVMKVPGATISALQSVSVITSWPSELLARYDSEGLFMDSPTVAHMRVSSLPLSYDISAVNLKVDADKKKRI